MIRVDPITRPQHEPIQVAGPFEWNPLFKNRHKGVIEKLIALGNTRFHQCRDSVDDPSEHRQVVSPVPEAVSRNTVAARAAVATSPASSAAAASR